jgi:tyrosine-protein phosphatase SIW14
MDVLDSLHSMRIRRLVTGIVLLTLVAGVRATRAQSSRAAGQAAVSIASPSFGEKIHIAGVPNAGKVTGQLFRGAQPHDGSIRQLKELGITTIVDLRSEGAGTREREKKEADSLGIRFISIPVNGWSSPTSDQVAQFLSMFGLSSKEIVFVHCRLGEDRTGVFVATYRMAVQKWSTEQAMSEMYYFGFNGFVHRAMKSFVRNFPSLFLTSPSFVKLGFSQS